MPLFGLRKTKKNEQSQIETSAGEAKSAVTKTRRSSSSAVVERNAVTQVSKQALMPTGSFSSDADAIIRPHITEKTGVLSQNGVYTFQITKNANKQGVMKAIKALYKVTPVKVGMVNIRSKNVFIRGKRGSVPGMKKAVVTLKKGEKIDFV